MTSRIMCGLAGLTLAACASAQPPAQTEPATVPSAPTLVVMITVDQLRPDYFTRWPRQLTGGLGRLYTRGAFHTNAFQDHAITETAPGHSVILSGRFPRSTGIYANALGVNTDSAPLIGSRARGASPFRFRGTTLVDWLVAKNANTRVLSVSRKDRGAILPVGVGRHHVYWYADPGLFTTSSYYRDTLPSWVSAFNARGLPRRSAGNSWQLLRPASEYDEVDSVAIENGASGRRVTFPHVMPADSNTAALILPNFPWMDELTLAFALEGVQQLSLGTGPHTDVLAISLSTMDAVGHAFGPDSREVHDMMLRLDQYLEVFFRRLYAMRDSTRIVVALTADHGVNPFPEVPSRWDNNRGASRVDPQDLFAAMRAGLLSIGVDSGAYEYVEDMVRVDRNALAASKVSVDSAAATVARALLRVPGVYRAETHRTMARADTTRDAIVRRWIHMVPPGSGDVYVTLRPHWDPAGGSFYARHGSPHDYDARVPVILYGPWIRPGRYDQFARVVDIAPTLAAIVSVQPAERLDGRVLRHALLKP